LFIPVFPIRAYRVRETAGGYAFQSIVPLSAFAHACRALVLVALVGGGAALGYDSYVSSDSYRVSASLEEAKALEEAGDADGAIERYRAILNEHLYAGDVSHAATRIVELTAAKVPDPCGAGDVDQIGRVVNGFFELPEAARGPAQDVLVTALLKWAAQIGDASIAEARASFVVLDMAAPLDDARAAAPRAAALEKLADALAPARPLMALSHYTSMVPLEAGALAKARAIIETFGAAPSQWIEVAPQIETWLAAARAGTDVAAAKAIATSLKDAQTRHAADLVLLEEGDEKQIAAALAEQPDNQELAASVAGELRAQGNVSAAIATLVAVGVGRMTANNTQLLGILYRDAGKLGEADALLTPFVDERMSAYQAAQRAYGTAITAAKERLVSQVQAGNVPPEIEARLNAASGDEAVNAILVEYMQNEIAGDPNLSRLQAEYLRHEAVVPASMTLGMVKLGRASEASGKERDALLADAERAFLAIRAAAEGQPSYHLGLGEIYHRLGKVEDGDRELDALLGQGSPELASEVANVYRSLGKLAKCRAILEQQHASASDERIKHHAAYMLSLLAASLDDKELWLNKSDATASAVKASLHEVQGARALLRDDREGADRAFAASAKIWSQEAEHNAAAVNNVAVASMARYSATGDVTHLRNAASQFDQSMRRQPDAAITTQNAMDTHEHLGLATVLERHLKVDVLALSQGECEVIVDMVLDSDDGDAVRAALKADKHLQRAQELAKRVQLLAPHHQDGYRTELRWFSWHDDVAGMKGLHERLSRGQRLDIGQTAVQRREFEAGTRDAESLRSLEQGTAIAAHRLARAKASGHAATIAAAHITAGALVANRLLAFEQGTITELVAPYRAAYEAWPQGGTANRLFNVLNTAAIFGARQATPAFDQLYTAQYRKQSVMPLVESAVRGPSGAEIAAAIAKQPEVTEARELLRKHPRTKGSFNLYLWGGWTGDDELRKFGATVFDNPIALSSRKIEVLLYPGEAREAAELALYEAASEANR
jgi:hypothetical protein